eukprot:c8027_g1_i1 orf=121-1023(+)
MYSSYQGPSDGASLFSGGGFMPTQSATQQTADPFSPARRSGSQHTGLLPLTVKQMSSATQKPADDTFYVDGVDVNNVTLVGMVFEKEEKVTDVSFSLDDGTGRIEVKRWIDGQDTHESMEMSSIRNGAYVRVHGHLRSFQGRRNVVAFSVRPITDFNEITFHFIECVFVHLSNLKSTGVTSTPATASTPYVGHNPVMNTSAFGGSRTGPQNVGGIGNYNQYMPPPASASGSSMGEIYKRVQAIFEEPASLAPEAGLHIDEVARRMPGFSKKQVKDAVEFLVNEGVIYSTIDDDHFKSTNG